MRGTTATLVCLVSLHFLSVVDAYTAKFTSENGMPGREHEDKHPRRSTNAKRSLSKTMRQEPDYNWEDYGGIPNIPGYMYRDAYADMDLDAYDDMDEHGVRETSQRRLNPEGQRSRRSAGAKRSLSGSPQKSKRIWNFEDYYYYDNDDNVGFGMQYIPNYHGRGADINADTGADADENSFSKTLQRLLSPVVDSVRQLWERVTGKSLESVGGGDTKRENSRNEPLKKRAMEDRNDEDREIVNPRKRNVGSVLNYLTELAKKALDFAYHVIDKLDVSQLTEETKKLKEAVLEILKKAKKAVEELLDKISRGAESPYSRRARSVGKRTNARDALESYLTSLKSLKRSKTRSSLRRSMRGNTSARASDMTALMDMMTEMEECIHKIPPTNMSLLGAECIVLPLLKALTSPKLGGANGFNMDADSHTRPDTIESLDNLRRLNFPWGSIFLIPIYNGQRPGVNETVPPYSHQGFDNETTTTTTTEPPTTTTTTLPTPIFDEPDRSVRSNSKYRSKYDNRF